MIQALGRVTLLVVCVAFGFSAVPATADVAYLQNSGTQWGNTALGGGTFQLNEVVQNEPDDDTNFAGQPVNNSQLLYDNCLVGTNFGADPYCPRFRPGRWFQFRGWLDAGILGNASAPASHFNGPYNSEEVDNGQFNQAYLIMERTMAADGSFTVGGRADLLYGSDYFLAQSTGLEKTRTARRLEQQSILRARDAASLRRTGHHRRFGQGRAFLHDRGLRRRAVDDQLLLFALL